MQYLFKTALSCLCLQAIAFGVGYLFGGRVEGGLWAASGALLVYSFFAFAPIKKGDTLAFARLNVISSNMMGSMLLLAVLSFEGPLGTLLACIAAAFVVLRCFGTGRLMSQLPTKPEKFWDAFFGTLPFGIGLVTSFVVMWNRVSKENDAMPPPA